MQGCLASRRQERIHGRLLAQQFEFHACPGRRALPCGGRLLRLLDEPFVDDLLRREASVAQGRLPQGLGGHARPERCRLAEGFNHLPMLLERGLEPRLRGDPNGHFLAELGRLGLRTLGSVPLGRRLGLQRVMALVAFLDGEVVVLLRGLPDLVRVHLRGV